MGSEILHSIKDIIFKLFRSHQNVLSVFRGHKWGPTDAPTNPAASSLPAGSGGLSPISEGVGSAQLRAASRPADAGTFLWQEGWTLSLRARPWMALYLGPHEGHGLILQTAPSH